MTIVGILFLICLWLRLDWLIGLHSLKRQRASSIYPWRSGNLTFYDDGIEWMKTLELDCIQAKESICISFYIIQPDEVGRRLFTLLKERAQEGVHVRLLVDALGSHKMKKWLKPLQDEGIEVGMSRPPIFKGSLFALQRRNHRKIAIVDGVVAHIGGFNIGREYVHLDPVLSPWRDYHLRFTGEGVQDALMEFEIDWKREFDETSRLKKIDVAEESVEKKEKMTSKHQIVPSEPIDLEAFMISLFNQAQSSIFIGTPYFIPTKAVFSSLIKRLEEGIKLTILVPGTPDHVLVQPASYRYLRELIDCGAQVFHFQNGFYHAKALLIDQTLGDIGTANFDRRSLLINDEINVLTDDPAIIAQLLASIDKDLEHSVLLTKEQIKANGMVDVTKEWLARSISHLL
ncbi:phospholipase D-like domain-containing protein [Jeotgalibacillus marinus]|uniref:Phospholipase D-like domain-containing protein n=1 Tax=Jeotgalibacillus marinus TaxID=86667 RepID=A0ABV3Q0K5_9BACL